MDLFLPGLQATEQRGKGNGVFLVTNFLYKREPKHAEGNWKAMV